MTELQVRYQNLLNERAKLAETERANRIKEEMEDSSNLAKYGILYNLVTQGQKDQDYFQALSPEGRWMMRATNMIGPGYVDQILSPLERVFKLIGGASSGSKR